MGEQEHLSGVAFLSAVLLLGSSSSQVPSGKGNNKEAGW